MNKKNWVLLLMAGFIGLCQVQSLEAMHEVLFHPESFDGGAGHQPEGPREEGPRIDVDFIQRLHDQQQAGDRDRMTGSGLKSGQTVSVKPVSGQLPPEDDQEVAGGTTGTVFMSVEDHNAIEELATEDAGDFADRVSAEVQAHELRTEATPTEVASRNIKLQLIREFRQKLMTSEALKEILDNPGAFRECRGYKEINEKIGTFERNVLRSLDPETLREQMDEVIEDIRGSKLVLLEYRKQAEEAALKEQKKNTKGFIFKKKPLRKVTAQDLKNLESFDRSNSLQSKVNDLSERLDADFKVRTHETFYIRGDGKDNRVWNDPEVDSRSHEALKKQTEDQRDALTKQNYNYEQRVNDITDAQRDLQKLMENPKATKKQMAEYKRKRDLLAKEKAEIAVRRGGLRDIYTFDRGSRPDKLGREARLGYQKPAEGNIPADTVITNDHGTWGLHDNRQDSSRNPKYEKVYKDVEDGLHEAFTYLNALETIRTVGQSRTTPPALLRSVSAINAELEKLAQPGLDPKNEAAIQKKISVLIKKINSLPEVRNVREVQVQRPVRSMEPVQWLPPYAIDSLGRPLVHIDPVTRQPVDSNGQRLFDRYDELGNYIGLFH